LTGGRRRTHDPRFLRPPSHPHPTLRDLTRDPALEPLRRRVHDEAAETLAEQLALVRIPAPSLAEGPRAAYLLERFHALGLDAVRQDEVGNVLGEWGPAEGAAGVVVAAHLDTVFPAGTDVEPRHEGRRIHAPGITDNCRGLAALLALARVLPAAVPPARRVVLVGSVGEEGIGDLRGVKHLFREGSPLREAGAFVALDGSGVRRIVHRAIGSLRLRVVIEGPGGHSWSDRGAANPAVALGAAVAALAALPLPHPARSALTVARLGGGTSVNSIPAEAWMEVDLRSEVAGVLPQLEEQLRAILVRALGEQNGARRRGTPPLSHQVRVIGDRPSGETAPDHPLVRLAATATRALGAEPELVGSSTDANVPMALGIPSIAIGAGGDSGGIHTLDEWYANDGGPTGVERALLVVLSAAGA
jgi:tripeptide aminopeptidase